MTGFHYFGCKDTLEEITLAFSAGLWTLTCPTCGVVNKLAPDPERRHEFIVTGAFVGTQNRSA